MERDSTYRIQLFRAADDGSGSDGNFLTHDGDEVSEWLDWQLEAGYMLHSLQPTANADGVWLVATVVLTPTPDPGLYEPVR